MKNDYLLTYQDAVEITKQYNNFNFSEHKYMIDGYKICIFDYFICGYNDFANPLPDKPHIHAMDMRGTTFVFDKEGNLWRTFFMLPKFFNVNQVEETQYDKIKDKTVLHVSEKEDGSLIAIMMLPNGELFAKTIRAIGNEQSVGAMNVLNADIEKVNWVKNIISEGYTPLFEYVSWDNRIVLKYSKAELRFIGGRHNQSGVFVPASVFKGDVPFRRVKNLSEEKSISVEEGKEFNFNMPPTLESLMERAKVETDREGWVILLANDDNVGDIDMMVKIKTDWYWKVHGIRTDFIFREDYVIKNYFEETLDEVVSQLDPEEDGDALKFVERVTGSIKNFYAYINDKVTKLYDVLQEEYDGEWNRFATERHKESYFGFVKYYEDKLELRRRIVEYILKKTYKLKFARQIVEKYGGTHNV